MRRSVGGFGFENMIITTLNNPTIVGHDNLLKPMLIRII
jgi:hypothetical protein